MHLLDQTTLGIIILVLLGMLVIVKQTATGSIFDKPQGSFLIRLTNIFNLFFLLVVNPLAAILLITRNLEAVDPTHLAVNVPWLLMVLELGGSGAVCAGVYSHGVGIDRVGTDLSVRGKRSSRCG